MKLLGRLMLYAGGSQSLQYVSSPFLFDVTVYPFYIHNTVTAAKRTQTFKKLTL